MNLDYIEDLIERENIYLKDTYIEDSEGIYVNYRKVNAILYDSSKLENSYEKKQVLADYFEVTFEYMKNAINFYTDKYGDFTKEALLS